MRKHPKQPIDVAKVREEPQELQELQELQEPTTLRTENLTLPMTAQVRKGQLQISL